MPATTTAIAAVDNSVIIAAAAALGHLSTGILIAGRIDANNAACFTDARDIRAGLIKWIATYLNGSKYPMSDLQEMLDGAQKHTDATRLSPEEIQAVEFFKNRAIHATTIRRA